MPESYDKYLERYRAIGKTAPASSPEPEPYAANLEHYRALGRGESPDTSTPTSPDTILGSASRGFETSFEQIPQLLYGVVLGGAATAEKYLGAGGLSTVVKDYALGEYVRREEEIQKKSKPTDSATEAYRRASEEGDFGALVHFVSYGVGYMGGQVLQSLATGGVGSIVAKAAARKIASGTVESMVAKEADALAAKSITKELATSAPIQQLAVRNVTQKIGRMGEVAALGGQSVGMEGGEIFGDLVAEKAGRGESLTGEDIAKALGASLAAGSLELVADKFGLDLVLGRKTAGLAKGMTGLTGKAVRAGALGTLGAAVEGGTEFGQTLIEEAGKGHDPLSRESIMGAIDATALGVVGGAAIGGFSGAISKPQSPLTPEQQLVKEKLRSGAAPPPAAGTGDLDQLTKDQSAIMGTPADGSGIDLERLGKEQNYIGSEAQIAEQEGTVAGALATATTPATATTTPPLTEAVVEPPVTEEPVVDDRTPGQAIMDRVQDTGVVDERGPIVKQDEKLPAIGPITTREDATLAIEKMRLEQAAASDVEREVKRQEGVVEGVTQESSTDPTTQPITQPITQPTEQPEAVTLPVGVEDIPSHVVAKEVTAKLETRPEITTQNITDAPTIEAAAALADASIGGQPVPTPVKIKGKGTITPLAQGSLFEQSKGQGEFIHGNIASEARVAKVMEWRTHFDETIVAPMLQEIPKILPADPKAGIEHKADGVYIRGAKFNLLDSTGIAKSKLGLDGFEAISFQAAALGKIALVFDDSDNLADGFFSHRPVDKKYIFVSSKTGANPIAVTAHELLHAHPEMKKAVLGLLKDPGVLGKDYAKYAMDRHSRRNAEGKVIGILSKDALDEEVGADLLGHAMYDVERFMPKVFKHLNGEYGAPKAKEHVLGFMEKLAVYIKDVKERFQATTFLTPKGAVIAEKYVTDLDAFYNKLAPIVAKHYGKVSALVAEKGVQGLVEKSSKQTLATPLMPTTGRQFEMIPKEASGSSGTLFIAKRDMVVRVKNPLYPHSVIPRGSRLSAEVLKASGYAAPVVKAEPEVGSEEEFRNYMTRVERFRLNPEIPTYAKMAIVGTERAERTNKQRDPHLSDATWEKQTVTLESLKEKNADLIVPGKFKGQYRGSMTKGPIVLDHEGNIIDGTNRTLEAVKKGEKTIEVYRPKTTPDIVRKLTLSPRQSGVDPVVLISDEDTAGGAKRVNELLAMLRHYPVVSGKGSNEALLEELHDVMVSNLKWLYKQVPADLRERAKLWYDGANVMTKQWAEIYKVSHEKAAAVMAVFSPQMDWFSNVTLAERTLDIFQKRQHETVTPAMVTWAQGYADYIQSDTTDTPRHSVLGHMQRLAKAKTPFKEMDVRDAALFVRIFDETYHDRSYRIVTPEGGFVDWARTAVEDEDDAYGTVIGDKIGKRWSSFNPIEKALIILRKAENPALEDIGQSDKVVNFYKNIIDPNSTSGEVTVDTHAVAAAQLRAFSGQSKEVSDAWSRAGLYEVYRRAYADAAFEFKILPREMQSITWETVRSLFPATMKTKENLKDRVDEQWTLYREKQQTLAKTRNEIFKLSGGIKKFMWQDGGTGLFPDQGGKSFDTVVAEKVSQRKANLYPVRPKKKTKVVDTTGNLFSPKQTVRLTHYSKQEGLTTIDPKYHGTGQAGAETRRKLNAEPGTYVDRSYFYREGAKPEARFKKQHKYTVEVDESQLFDMADEPGDLTTLEQEASHTHLGAFNSRGAMPEAVMLFKPAKVVLSPKQELKLDETLQKEMDTFEEENEEEIEDLKSRLSSVLGNRISFSQKAPKGSAIKHPLYHGTKQEFPSFPLPSSGKNSSIFGDYDAKRHAIFLAKDPTVAEVFANQGLREEELGGQRIIKLYADIRQPLDLRGGLREKDETKLPSTFANYIHYLPNAEIWEMFDDENDGAENVAMLKAAGYDAVIFNESISGKGIDKTTFAVFDSAKTTLAAGANVSGIAPSHGHPISFSNKLTEDERQLADEYDDAPVFDEASVPSWKALMAQVEEDYLEVSSIVDVQYVAGQPYADAETMHADIANGVLKVSTDFNTHPVWNETENGHFRAVHDYFGHYKTGGDFSLEGERKTYAAHLAMNRNPAALNAMKVEVYGQVVAALKHDGTFQTQKVFTLKEFSSVALSPKAFIEDAKVREKNRKAFLKDSKVKHPVYHATGYEFSEFHRAGEIGIHLGTAGQAKDRIALKAAMNPQLSEYAAGEGQTYNTIKAYISLKNPLRMKDAGTWQPETMLDELQKKFPDLVMDETRTPSKIRQFLQDKGYDGIVYKNTGEAEGLEDFRIEKDAAYGDWQELRADRFASDEGTPISRAEMEAEAAYNLAYDDWQEYRKANAEDSYIVFEPTQIKSATGNTGAYDATNPDIRYAPKKKKAAAVVTPPVAAPPFPPAVTYQVDQPTRLDAVVRKLQDKNIDVARMLTAIKDAGGVVPTEANPVLREEMYHKLVEQLDKDFETDELRPLLEMMRVNKVSIQQLNDYLHARHIIDDDLNAKFDAMNPKHPDAGKLAGQTDAWAKAVLAAPNAAAIRPLLRRVDAIMKKTRQMSVGYGLESQNTINTWEATYKAYVPLHREGFEDQGYGEGSGKSVRGSAVKQRMGSGKEVGDILANIAQYRSQVIGQGERQKPVKAMAAMIAMHPNVSIATLVRPTPVEVTNPLTGLMQVVPGDITLANGSKYEVPKIKMLDKKTNTVKFIVDPTYKARPNVVNFRLAGVDYAIVFNEENARAMEISKAFKNLDTPQMGLVLSGVAKATRFLAAINTQYNPVFGIVNFVRDVQFAMLALNSTPLADQKAEILRATMSSIRGIYSDARAIRNGQHPTSPTARMWERFQHVGGPTGYRDIFLNTGDRTKNLEWMLNPKSWKEVLTRSPLDIGKKTKDSALAEWLSDYNTTMENAVRLGVFTAGVNRGMKDIEAASLAKNITVNFNKKGQVGAQMGALYAFFNANVQGTARILETVFEPVKAGQPIRVSSVGKKIMVGGILLGIMQTFILAMAGYDENEVPEFIKQRAFIIPVPGQNYLQIPMPLGFNVLPNIGRLFAETLRGLLTSGNGKIAEHTWDLLGAVLSTFVPVGGSESLLQTILPTVLDPIAGLDANQDWTGKPIYKEDLDRRNPTPGHARTRDHATPWAVLFAHAINYVTGGNEYRPGQLSPTPDAIDYLIGQVTGGVGREASKLVQGAQSLMTGQDLPMHKIPLVGRFLGTTDGASTVRDRYYDNTKKINIEYNEFKGRRKNDDDAEEFIASAPEARLHAMASTIDSEIQKANRQRRKFIEEGAPQAQVNLIETRITSMMKRLNDAYRDKTEGKE